MNGFRMTVVLFKKVLSVSISYITAPLVSSTRVVSRGVFFVKTSFIAIATSRMSSVLVETLAPGRSNGSLGT